MYKSYLQIRNEEETARKKLELLFKFINNSLFNKKQSKNRIKSKGIWVSTVYHCGKERIGNHD